MPSWRACPGCSMSAPGLRNQSTRSCRMSDAVPDIVQCRLCTGPVARDAKICPACGVKEPWIPNEPAMNRRVIRLAVWTVGVVLAGLLLLLSGVLMFAPAEHERDHRPPGAAAEHDE